VADRAPRTARPRSGRRPGRNRAPKGRRGRTLGAIGARRPLVRMEDQGPPKIVPLGILGSTGRDGADGVRTQDFLAANRSTLSLLDVIPEVAALEGRVSAQLRPGGSVGAVPLYAPDTRRIVGGLVVRPRFGWRGIGPLLNEIGWSAAPRVLGLPLVPGSAREVPPWILAGPVIERLRALLREITRGFRMHEEVRSQPRGQIIWGQYVTGQASRGHMELLPCRFPDLGPDLQLRGFIRWGLEKVLASLLPHAGADPVARRLAGQAGEMLLGLREAKAQAPGQAGLRWLLRVTGLPTEFLVKGIEALQWLADERGLGGMSETDGLAWAMPMHELFERWVEHVVRAWAREFGGVVRCARDGGTLVPIVWDTRAYGSLSSLQPDVVVRAPGRTWIVDAKYKGHFMELDEQRWVELGDNLCEEHRHDLHQVLAYAATCGDESVVAVLAYPMRLGTWERLARTGRTVSMAEVSHGGRDLRVALVGLPLEVPADWRGVPGEWGRLRAELSE